MDRRHLGAVLAVTALSVGACGSNDGDREGGGGAAAGDPIKVMVIAALESETLSVPQLVDGVEAAAAAVNDDGGIGGRDVEVLSCNTREDENTAAGCARDAAEEGVVAVVGASTTRSGAVLPVLEAAGIPSLPAFPISAEDFTSAVSFPITGGTRVEFSGAAQLLTEQEGAENVGIIIRDAASGEAGAQFTTATLEALGASVGQVSRLPGSGGGDVAPQLSAAADGADGVVMIVNQPQTAALLRQAEQSGVDVPLAGTDAALTDSMIPELGAAAEGYYAAGSAPPALSDQEAAVQFREEMEAHGTPDSADGLSIVAWTQMHLLAEVTGDLDEVNAETVLEAMNGIEGLDYLWLQDFSTTAESDLEGFNRLFNTRVYFSQVQDGAKVLLQPESVEVELA